MQLLFAKCMLAYAMSVYFCFCKLFALRCLACCSVPYEQFCMLQSNLAKQLAKLVKVKYVEDITYASRVGELLQCLPLVYVTFSPMFPLRS